MTPNEAWAALIEEMNPPAQPEGSMTVADWAERCNVPMTTAQRQIEKLVADGRLRAVRCKIVSRGGKFVSGNAYLPVTPCG